MAWIAIDHRPDVDEAGGKAPRADRVEGGRKTSVRLPTQMIEGSQAALATASFSGSGVAHFTPLTPGISHKAKMLVTPIASLRR